MKEGSDHSPARGRDPLAEPPLSRGQKIARLIGGIGAAGVVHLVLGFLLVTLAPTCNIEAEEVEEDSLVEVAVVEEPAPEPPPEPPAPEVPDEPEEPEAPEPEPEPPPEPEPTPDPSKPEVAETIPEPEEPVEEPADEPESMDPVNLEGLELGSTSATAEGPAFKTGAGIKTGQVTNKYVDPDRLGSIKTGEGDGEGYGSGERPAAPQARNCPVKKPEPLERVRVPESAYPLEAKRRGIGGTIVAILTVGTDGRVSQVKIVEGLGHGFDDLARDAFKKWRFEPARRDCQAVTDTIRATHAFSISNY